MISNRVYKPLTKSDLQKLKELALLEHEEFFKRNPHLKGIYYDSLIGICLCQGAASHYLNPKIGIKDFDIWHFYEEAENIVFPYRAHKRIIKGCRGIPIDFLKRAIPKSTCNSYPGNPEQIIMKYLRERNTKSKRLLLKKAIIGLYPESIFGKVIWRGEL